MLSKAAIIESMNKIDKTFEEIKHQLWWDNDIKYRILSIDYENRDVYWCLGIVPDQAMESVINMLCSKGFLVKSKSIGGFYSSIDVKLSQVSADVLSELREFQSHFSIKKEAVEKANEMANSEIKAMVNDLWSFISEQIMGGNGIRYIKKDILYIKLCFKYCYYGAKLEFLYEYDGLEKLEELAQKEGFSFIDYYTNTGILELRI